MERPTDDEWSQEDVPPVAVIMTLLGVAVLMVIVMLWMIMS
jgi:hypothetical protein